MVMGPKPEYPDDPAELKPPSSNSLPMHGFDENSDSDDNELQNDRLPSVDPYAGYQQLNLEDMPDGDDNDDEDDEDSSNVQESAADIQGPTADAEIACQVWNAPRPNEYDIKIDSTKSDEIKSVMSKVTLGVIEPPEWAKHIPESKWIEELLQKVRRNKSIGNHSTNQISQSDPSASSSK